MDPPPPLSRPAPPVRLSGSCHCKRVRFSVTVRRFDVSECNCSVCAKKGNLALIVEAADFQLETGSEALTVYTFNTGTARHLFCATCGIHPFYVPRSHPAGISVNIRCLDDVPLSWFDPTPFDGRHWEANVEALRRRLHRS